MPGNRLRAAWRSIIGTAGPISASGEALPHEVGAGNPKLQPRAGGEHRFGFLVGIGKSGTNWAGSLLNLHPRLLCDGEFHFQYFFDAYRQFVGSPWLVGSRHAVGVAARAGLEDLVRRGMLAIAGGKPTANWLIDRTPRPFEVFLPEAPHLYIMRDGRDLLVSFTFHQLRSRGPEHFPPEVREWYRGFWEAFQRNPACVTPADPGLLGEEQWVRYHARRWATQLRQDISQISVAAQFQRPTRTLILRYEDLHADPDRWRSRMYAHFDVDPAEAALLSRESKTAPEFGREDRASFYRKGEVGDWKNYASDNFRRWFREEAGDVLIEHAYESSDAW